MDKANENTYHATAQIAAPGIWLLNVSFLFGSMVKIISKNTNKIPKSTKPRSLTIRSVRLCNSGIYSTARSCSVFPKTRTTSVNTTANKNTIV